MPAPLTNTAAIADAQIALCTARDLATLAQRRIRTATGTPTADSPTLALELQIDRVRQAAAEAAHQLHRETGIEIPAPQEP